MALRCRSWSRVFILELSFCMLVMNIGNRAQAIESPPSNLAGQLAVNSAIPAGLPLHPPPWPGSEQQ